MAWIGHRRLVVDARERTGPATREVRTLADVMTLMTLGDSDVRMAALIDLTVVQGELRTLGLRLPARS